MFNPRLTATPQQKAGAKPVVALPNPFYQAYFGVALVHDEKTTREAMTRLASML